MPCPSENALLEYAGGLAGADVRREIAEHIGDCDACRRVLAAIAKDDATAPTTPTKELAERELLPAELLARYLRKDAAQRELTASAIVAAMTVIGMASLTLAYMTRPEVAAHAPVAAMLAQPVVFVYAIAVHLGIRRGWFHPAIPFVSTLLEVSIGFVMLMGVASARPAEAVTTAFLMLIAGYIVFTAVRVDPRICIAAGTVAALEQIAIHLRAQATMPDYDISAVHVRGAAGRAILCLLCGVAGWAMARHFLRRAEEALREIREQDMFGKYLLHERLGGGGMGDVYRATYCPEGGFVRDVAIKRMRPDLTDDPSFANAFRREAELSARLAHPNLVHVLDCGRFQGTFVFVMEFVDGISLSRLLRARGQLPPRVAAFVAAELAAGLAYVHSRLDSSGEPMGLVHLDVNPPNVMISAIGEVKLADFGVARVKEDKEDSVQGGFAGKLHYAAPEQLLNAPVDQRADLYALGLTMHEMLTGRRVFSGSADTAITGSIPPLAAIPSALAQIVMDLLAEDPAARPRDGATVRERLLALGGDLAPYPTAVAELARAVRDAQR